MSISYVGYDLEEGFISNWLTAGPQAIPVETPPELPCDNLPAAVAKKYYQKNSGITGQPVEPGPLDKSSFQIGNYTGQWNYTHCQDDHLVDHSITLPELTYLRSWAYSQLISPDDQEVQLTIFTQGPVDVWINKKIVCHSDTFAAFPTQTAFSAPLVKGANKVLVRFAGVAMPDCILVMGLRVNASNLNVRIPTLIPSISRRNELEAVNRMVYLDRDIYASDEMISICWPEGPEKSAYQDIRLQTPGGRIYGTLEDKGKPGEKQILGNAASLNQGEYRALIMPRAWEFYESNIRVTRELNLSVSGINRFSEGPYGTQAERTHEALLDAAYRENDLYAELAKMALGVWNSIEPKVFEDAIQKVTRRKAGSELLLLGLLGGVLRFGKKPGFPLNIKEQVKAAALSYRYWQDEPGCDTLTFDHESRQIIFHTCEILAGQLYPTLTFTNSGLTGRKHREKGEALAASWIKERGANGFVEWDSPQGYEEILAALSHLIDLSKTEAIWDLASVLMDKIFFSIALNSYKGVFGGSQSNATTQGIKGGLLQPTAGITRLMWGMGMFNHHLPGAVSLAMMKKYELPPIIADIAAGLPPEIWDREQSAALGKSVNRVSYRTPDFMLSSAQDYHPGQRGSREHIWQATLGPKAVVFVNHPACSTQNDSHAPNFWLGNGSLPRVAQQKETLIALYNLPADALLHYTHAYFPVIEFDEYVINGSAAFARKGSAYLALTAAQGLELVQSGPAAYRELRSQGLQNVWVCQMGRETLDGNFSSFQARVLANPPEFMGLSAMIQTPRDGRLEFSWDGQFTSNGSPISLTGYPHFENPYTTTPLPCREMEIHTEDYLLRLKFGEL